MTTQPNAHPLGHHGEGNIIAAGLNSWFSDLPAEWGMDGQRSMATDEPFRFASILDIAEEGIVAVDRSQQIVLFNHGAEKIFGFRSADAIGKSIDILIPERFGPKHEWHLVFPNSVQHLTFGLMSRFHE